MATVDGVLTKTNDSSTVDTGTEQYITWSDDADLDDGWYAVDDDITETDAGDLVVEFTDADGETHEVDGVAVEQDSLIDRKHTPVDAAVVDPEMSGAHEAYDESYPDDPSLESNVALDDIEAELDDTQREQIERGLGKAQDLGLTDNVTAVTEMDVEGEASGMTLGRFEPETGEIKINTERMNQETLDSVDDAFAVGENVEDMLVHESIHAEHAQALEDSGMTPEEMREQFLRNDLPDSEQELMEDAVSEYGAANPLEVVAEIGTKITLGQEVSDEALHLYEKYGGPEL
jgi:energy-coupling factor transporter ATP-binding protein EcfA2